MKDCLLLVHCLSMFWLSFMFCGNRNYDFLWLISDDDNNIELEKQTTKWVNTTWVRFVHTLSCGYLHLWVATVQRIFTDHGTLSVSVSVLSYKTISISYRYPQKIVDIRKISIHGYMSTHLWHVACYCIDAGAGDDDDDGWRIFAGLQMRCRLLLQHTLMPKWCQ